MKVRDLHPPRFWRYLVQRQFQRAHPQAPVFVANAVVLLNAWLRRSDRGFEWGSGQSTVWLAERLAHLTSIEHDASWHGRVAQRLEERRLGNRVDYRLIAASDEQMDEPEGHPYANAIDGIPDRNLDFILIDGQMRFRCAERAISKVKPGGILVLDGANRYVPNRFESGHTTIGVFRDEPLDEGWRDLLERLRGWRWIHTTDGVWDTRMWVRPGAEDTGS